MPKVKIGKKVKHFPYTAKGIKEAKMEALMKGGEMMVDKKMGKKKK